MSRETRAQRSYDRKWRRDMEKDRKVRTCCARCGKVELCHGTWITRTGGACKLFLSPDA